MSSSRRRLNPLDLNAISNFEDVSVAHLFQGDELAKDRACLLDLSCLCGKTNFVPDKVFVRSEMQTVLQGVLSKEPEKAHILIGSPGVGKSVVLFLAALHLAAVKKKKVIYVRWNEIFENPTVFVMKSGERDGFCQLGSISFFKVQHSLEDVARAALEYGYEIGNDWRLFLDGPKEATVALLKDLRFDLCTSGGYGTPSDADRMKTEIRIMAGWTEADLVAALIQIEKLTPKKARNVYFECGGRMRLALDYVKDETAVVSWADGVVADLGDAPCILAMSQTEARTSVESKDRMRTMFRGSNGRPVQLVDSQYLLEKLRNRLTVDNLRQAYRVAVALDSRTMIGVLFEEIMHKWFQKVKPNPVVDFVRSPKEKTGREGVADLSRIFLYWVPSTPNFANIDAAFVDANRVLHCIQYTIKDSHGFDTTAFDDNFIKELKTGFPNGFQKVVIYFAVPVGVNFNIREHDDFECDEGSTTCELKVVHLNVNTDEEIQSSASALLETSAGNNNNMNDSS